MNLLGLQTVIDFVRTLSVVGAFKGKAQAFDVQQFWQHSIAVGVIGKQLVDRPELKGKLDIGGDDPFMAGMVHDIGKQVLGHFFNEMFQMVLDEMKAGNAMYDVEMDVLGLTHAHIGAGLAEKWQLPASLSAVIGHHHTPTVDEANEMTKLIHLADVAAKQLDMGFCEKQKDAQPNEGLMSALEIEAEAFGEMRGDMEITIRKQVAETFLPFSSDPKQRRPCQRTRGLDVIASRPLHCGFLLDSGDHDPPSRSPRLNLNELSV